MATFMTRPTFDRIAEIQEKLANESALIANSGAVLRASVGDLVRSMNCYYSNQIARPESKS